MSDETDDPTTRRLGVLVIFTAVVGDAHRRRGSWPSRYGWLRRRNRQPIDAAGEVANLDGDFAGEGGLDAPFQGVADPGREGDIQDVDGIGVGEGLELDAGGIDEGVGPGEFEFIDALAEGQDAGFLDECEVDGIVDGQLNGVAGGEGNDVDAGMGGACRQQNDEGDDVFRSGAPASGPAW